MIPHWNKLAKPAAFGLALAAATATGGCTAPTQVTIDDAWVRMPAVPGRPGAAYFTIHGGPRPATLIGVTSDLSIRSEMHESMSGGGMAGMRPIPKVEIPAAGEVKFQPGGRHVMLFGINPHARKDVTFLLTFTFADGSRITHNAPSVAAADAPAG